MGVIIVKNAVVRKPNCMYYINKNGDLCEAEMAHGRKGSKKAVKKPAVKKVAKKTAVKKTVVKKATVKKVVKKK
jgi:hypothetical protein